jgi:hypothetical protein
MQYASVAKNSKILVKNYIISVSMGLLKKTAHTKLR